MSLNAQEQAITSRELQANLAATGLSCAQVAADLGWSSLRLQHTLALGLPSSPADVWELRDYLVETVHALDGEETPFTILTEQARPQAQMWFPLRQPPQHISQSRQVG